MAGVSKIVSNITDAIRIRIGGAPLRQALTIPARFQTEVRDFAVSHAIRLIDENSRAPNILAIVGAPGEGKSEMVHEALGRLGVVVRRLSASELAGQYEGDSIAALKEEYAALGARPNILPPHCLQLDDFDLSAGRIDARMSGTINAAILNSCLMNIADDPTSVGTHTVKPSMIVLTANDSSQIYGPLMRPGRTRLFEWSPTVPEKAEMARGLFSSLSAAEVEALIDTYASFPISFFAQLPLMAAERAMQAALDEESRVNLANERMVSELASRLHQIGGSLTASQIQAAAEQLANTKNHRKSYLVE